MIKIGTLVRILNPDYVAGCKGRIQNNENGYWVIKLERGSFETTQQPILLSLKESDFEAI